MTSIPALTSANARRWAAARPLTYRAASFRATAARLVAPSAKAQYQRVEALTRVPWFGIAVIHEREASQRWDASIAQGDPWDRVSVHVPKGRGPFPSWEDAAVDALAHCAPYAARWTDWSVGGLLTLLEEYNGLGYANRGLPSPYIWSGTDQYRSGKYVADGQFDPNVVDQQLGCAGILVAMAEIDADVAAALGKPASPSSTSVPAVPPAPKQDANLRPAPARPSIRNPAPGSLGAWFKSLFTGGSK